MSSTPTPQQLADAQKELAKLPLLGPALWLYARDPNRKFTFVADPDWRLLPPLVLDQCKLYTKQEVPFAFFTLGLCQSRSGRPIAHESSDHRTARVEEWGYSLVN